MGSAVPAGSLILHPPCVRGARIDVTEPYIRIHNAMASELGWLSSGSRVMGSVCAQQELHRASLLLRAAAWRALVLGNHSS